MKKKKVWLVLVSVVCALFVLFGGTIILTGLKTVSVEYTTTLASGSNLNENTLNEVKESGNFSYGTSLLFMNFSQNISNIEKSNPYVKVEKIVRTFPNKINVYVSERIAKYRIKDSSNSSKWYVLDSEFKVIAVSNNEENIKQSTVKIEFLTDNLYVGEFYDNQVAMTNLNDILSGVYAKRREYFCVESINFSDNKFILSIKNDDCEIVLCETANLKEKAQRGIEVYYYGEYGNEEHPNFSGKKITISNDLGANISNK